MAFLTSQARTSADINGSKHYCGMAHDHDEHDTHEHLADADLMYGAYAKDILDSSSESGFRSQSRRSGSGGNALKNTCQVALVSDHRFYSTSYAQTSSTMISMLEGAGQRYRVCHASF